MRSKFVTIDYLDDWIKRRFEDFLLCCDQESMAEFAHQLSPWLQVRFVDGDPEGFVVSYEDHEDQDYLPRTP